MNKKNESAMPITGFATDASGAFCTEVIHQKGLTKREHFSGLAMQAYLMGNLQHPDVAMMPAEEVAREAVAYADALLAELEKSK